jgi:hypothetical protein
VPNILTCYSLSKLKTKQYFGETPTGTHAARTEGHPFGISHTQDGRDVYSGAVSTVLRGPRGSCSCSERKRTPCEGTRKGSGRPGLEEFWDSR